MRDRRQKQHHLITTRFGTKWKQATIGMGQKNSPCLRRISSRRRGLRKAFWLLELRKWSSRQQEEFAHRPSTIGAIAHELAASLCPPSSHDFIPTSTARFALPRRRCSLGARWTLSGPNQCSRLTWRRRVPRHTVPDITSSSSPPPHKADQPATPSRTAVTGSLSLYRRRKMKTRSRLSPSRIFGACCFLPDIILKAERCHRRRTQSPAQRRMSTS